MPVYIKTSFCQYVVVLASKYRRCILKSKNVCICYLQLPKKSNDFLDFENLLYIASEERVADNPTVHACLSVWINVVVKLCEHSMNSKGDRGRSADLGHMRRVRF